MYRATKRLLFGLTALVTTALLSCTIDDYEEGEGEYSLLTADFVRAHTNGSTLVDYVITDDGDSLHLTQPYAAKWASTPDTVYRAALYHKPSATDSPYTTEAVSLGQVLTLMPHTKDFFKKGMVTDPVKLQSVWMSRNGAYLNIGMLLMTGTGDDDKARHTLALLDDTLMVNADNTKTRHLKLYHSQGGVPEYYSHLTYLSIPASTIGADSAALTVNTYAGTVTKTLRLNK